MTLSNTKLIKNFKQKYISFKFHTYVVSNFILEYQYPYYLQWSGIHGEGYILLNKSIKVDKNKLKHFLIKHILSLCSRKCYFM